MKGIGSGLFQKARGFKALGVTLAVGLGMTACSRDYTVGYLYVTDATKTTNGRISAYAIDYQSGALTQIAGSSFDALGNDPVALKASPDGKSLYVLNQLGPTVAGISWFSIGTDGKLYPQHQYPVVQNAGATIVGTMPISEAIDPSGTFLYVTFRYQNGFTTANPGPGGFAVYPINKDGSIGTAVTNTTVGTTAANPLPYFPLGNNPVGIAISPNVPGITTGTKNYLYVIDQETVAGSGAGVLLTFAATSSGGNTTITAVPGAVLNGIGAGATPAAIAEDPSGNYIYVTDQTTNQLYGYLVSPSGAPVAMNASPFATQSFPEGVTIDPRGKFVYVANNGSSTISGYAIGTGGVLSGTASSSGTSVATGPTCIAIEPALGIYLYTSNNTDNSVSAAQLNPSTGALTAVQGTQFSAGDLPTCAVAVANGAHATQIVE